MRKKMNDFSMSYLDLGHDYLVGYDNLYDLMKSFTSSTDFKYFINGKDVSESTSKTSSSTQLSTSYNYYKTEDELIIQLSLAGCEKEDVDISIDKGVLYVVAERKLKTYDEEKLNNFRVIKGILNGKFSKQFTIGDDVDTNSIKATMENGILTIVLSKKEESKPQKIKIK
jgi:HSP20 family protein